MHPTYPISAAKKYLWHRGYHCIYSVFCSAYDGGRRRRTRLVAHPPRAYQCQKNRPVRIRGPHSGRTRRPATRYRRCQISQRRRNHRPRNGQTVSRNPSATGIPQSAIAPADSPHRSHHRKHLLQRRKRTSTVSFKRARRCARRRSPRCHRCHRYRPNLQLWRIQRQRNFQPNPAPQPPHEQRRIQKRWQPQPQPLLGKTTAPQRPHEYRNREKVGRGTTHIHVVVLVSFFRRNRHPTRRI